MKSLGNGWTSLYGGRSNRNKTVYDVIADEMVKQSNSVHQSFTNHFNALVQYGLRKYSAIYIGDIESSFIEEIGSRFQFKGNPKAHPNTFHLSKINDIKCRCNDRIISGICNDRDFFDICNDCINEIKS